jgi:hypothetical protein
MDVVFVGALEGGTSLHANPEVEGFIEQVWPHREFIPALESAVVATGKKVYIYNGSGVRATFPLKQFRSIQ